MASEIEGVTVENGIAVDNAVVLPGYFGHQDDRMDSGIMCTANLDPTVCRDADAQVIAGCAYCMDAENQMIEGCAYHNGHVDCLTVEEDAEFCDYRELRRCDVVDSVVSCAHIDDFDLSTLDFECVEVFGHLEWSSYALKVIDLTDPYNPVLTDGIVMPEDEAFVDVKAKGNTLYANYRFEVDVTGDSRPYAKYYYKEINFDNPLAPTVSDGVNIPGSLLDVDGAVIYTQDWAYDDADIETALNRLTVQNGVAHLDARMLLDDQEVRAVVADGLGNLLVDYSSMNDDNLPHISMVDPLGAMTVMSTLELEIPLYDIVGVDSGHILFSFVDPNRGGGLLLVNTEEPTRPFVQSFFPNTGGGRNVVFDNDRLFIPAGIIGMYDFDLNTSNLISE